MKPLRFFYIPNESARGDQVGPHKAFKILYEQGVLAALTSYSYLVERRRFATQAEAMSDLLRAVEAFQPDVVFWQHLNSTYPVDAGFLRRIKAVESRPKFVWHDPDPYGRFVKRIDGVMKTAIAECDLAVVKGLGYFAAQVRKAGAPRILFAMESYDDERFDKPWEPTRERGLDVAMIANLTCLKRIPGLYMPGGRNRKKLAELFYRAYGQRFAVFGAGQGWGREPYCRGPIAFSAQEQTLRTAWVSINWSQFDDIPFYFSDRLPISLASGVPHITNRQPGFEHVMPCAPGIYFVDTPEAALDVADMLLSMPREALIELGERGRRFAREQLNATVVYRDIVTGIREQLFHAEGASPR